MLNGGKKLMVKLDLMIGGVCYHPEAITIKRGEWKTQEFPAVFALITHPKVGNILFDTGYSERFFAETKKFPFQLYRFVTKVCVKQKEKAAYQLKEKGIAPDSIQYIFISHFHADHIGGLKDFPNAKFFCLQKSYEKLKNKKKFGALLRGFLKDLLPEDFEDRIIDVERSNKLKLANNFYPFTEAFDLFKDQSVLAIELPGHVDGQMGLILRNENDKYVFLIGDASWSTKAVERNLRPSFWAGLITHDRKAYNKTLLDLHTLHKNNPDILIIPSHCQKIADIRKSL